MLKFSYTMNMNSSTRAVGSWIREAGKKDREKLLAFLDQHGKSMPRVTLRMAIEKLDPEQRDYYMKLKS